MGIRGVAATPLAGAEVMMEMDEAAADK